MNVRIVAGVCLLLLIPAVALAADLRAGEQTSLQGRIVNDVYAVGGNVQSSATIVGDLAVAGGNILVDGSVSQDLAAAGGSVTILANVLDDVRIGGGNVTIAGTVGDDLLIGGGQIQITGDGVQGDLIVGGGVVNVNAPVRGNITVGAGEVFINAPVGGNVIFKGEKLTLGSAAVVGGNLSYESPKEVEMEEGAVVRGEVEYTETTSTKDIGVPFLVAMFSLAFLAGFLMSLVGALAIGLFFKRYSEMLVNDALANPLADIGRGLVALILLPIVSIILLVTVIGAPLGLLGLVGYAALLIAACLIAPIVLGAWLGSFIFKDGYKVTWKTILLGVVVYTLLTIVPFGWLAKFGLVLLAIGAMLKIKWSVAKEWR